MTKIVFTPNAKSDLLEIGDHIAFHLQNKTAARNTISQIRRTTSILQQFPECGTPLQYGTFPYRYLISGNYMIFYHLAPEGAVIDRILYARRDHLALLFRDEPEGE